VYDDRDNVFLHWQEKCPGLGSDRRGAVAYSCGMSPIASAVSRVGTIPPTGVLQRRALGEGGCASDADRVALGRARRRRLIRATRRRPARYPPKRARNMDVPAWGPRIQVTIRKGCAGPRPVRRGPVKQNRPTGVPALEAWDRRGGDPYHAAQRLPTSPGRVWAPLGETISKVRATH